MDKKKEFITWNEFGNMLVMLTMTIWLANLNLKYIFGVPRGGLIMAVHLSHHLKLEFVHTLDEISIDTPEGLLIVDDLTHTGITLEKLIPKMYRSKVKVATLFHKPTSTFVPDFFVEETTDWIVFPYERKDETPNREDCKHL